METREIKLSIETATRWANGSDEELKALALQTFPELAKKQLPKSWEELGNIKGYFIHNNSTVMNLTNITAIPCNENIYATENIAKSHGKAAAKLSQLMAVYNDGWVADWNDSNQKKWCLYMVRNKIILQDLSIEKKFLAFKDRETAQEFYINFKEDIEIYSNY